MIWFLLPVLHQIASFVSKRAPPAPAALGTPPEGAMAPEKVVKRGSWWDQEARVSNSWLLIMRKEKADICFYIKPKTGLQVVSM